MEQASFYKKEGALLGEMPQTKNSISYLTFRRVRFKKKKGRRRSSNFTQTVRRLGKFGKTRVCK